MALDSLLARLQSGAPDTSDTACNVSDVSRKPAWIKADTPDTADTSQINKVQTKKSVNQDDGKSQDIEVIRQWMIDGGRPPQDYMFRLIVEKCERDPEARARFVQEALATKARLLSNAEAGKQPIVNEKKVVRLAERDYRHYCNDCVFFDRGGYCKQWQKTNPHNSRYRPVPDVLRNCSLFKPKE